jgi:hypothetical protein
MEKEFKQAVGYRERDSRRSGMKPHEFIKRLIKDFRLNSVYYPGSGTDFTLDQVFGEKLIVYLDDEFDGRRFRSGENKGDFVVGRIENSPFKDGIFDSLYIQDIHAVDYEFPSMLSKVKPKGIIIFSMDDCEGGSMRDFRRLRDRPELKQKELSYYCGMFHIFEKIPNKRLR